MASFSSTRDEWQDSLREQLERLGHELAEVRTDLARRGRGTYRESRHLGEDLLDGLRDYLDGTLPAVRRGAHAMRRTARDNPAATAATAIVGVAVVGLAVAWFLRR